MASQGACGKTTAPVRWRPRFPTTRAATARRPRRPPSARGRVDRGQRALFQRDISSLLACDIQSVYVQVKHLLKLFPVYHEERFDAMGLTLVIAESLALQRFDTIVGQAIGELRESTPRPIRPASPSLDLDRSVVPLATAPAELGPVALGRKAFMLRRLAQLGMRVPEGFVLTTDVFLARDRMRATYLNVGMSPAVTEVVAATQGSWTAWDAYRRFVQS